MKPTWDMGADPTRRADKRHQVIQHCVYEIATGSWRPGDRLPSVRAAAREWSVSHLTVYHAYQQLVERGLVRSVPKSGFFVAGNERTSNLARHHRSLAQLFELVADTIRGHSDLSVLGALRCIAHVAEAQAKRLPECAFVECTMHQASAHAREIVARLRTPCVPLSTHELLGDPERLPTHVRLVLTTTVHIHELRSFIDLPRRQVLGVPVGLSQLRSSFYEPGAGTVLVVAIDAAIAEHIARNLVEQHGFTASRVASVSVEQARVNELLERVMSSPQRPTPRYTVILSPSLFESAHEPWRQCPQVAPADYRIAESAWPLIIERLGLPLGELQQDFLVA